MIRTVLLMDMSSVGNTSGVDRYIESLLKGMGKQDRYRLIWLSLRIDPDLIFHSEEHCGTHHKITIPLPEQSSPILGKEYWAEQYYQAVTDIAARYTDLSKVDIVHLHTLNLMDWGGVLRRRYGCKVVTHLHCIPWKAYYNSNRPLFNQLYQRYYLDKNYDMKPYLTNMSEERSYCEGDLLYYGGTLPEVVCSVTIPSDLVALSEAVGGLQIIGQSLEAGGGNSTIGSNGKLYIPKDVLSRGFFGNQYVQTYKITMIGGAISKIAGPVGNLITGYELIREIERGNIDGAILGLVGAIGAAAGASMGASVGAKIGAGIGGPSGALTGAVIGAITGGVLGAYTAEELYESIGSKTFLIF